MTDAVKSTEKRAAQSLIRMKQQSGEPIPIALRKVAEAPVKRRLLSADQKVDHVENALSSCRLDAASCLDAGMRAGMQTVIEVIESALNGELD